MHYVILDAAHRYFSDWNEETPVFASDLKDAFRFPSKDDALDRMRDNIAKDHDAERAPSFAGCRAASVVAEVLRALRRQEYNVKEGGAGVVITVEPKNSQEAKKTIPKDLHGVKISIRTTMGQVIR
jgi:hypothetical protein